MIFRPNLSFFDDGRTFPQAHRGTEHDLQQPGCPEIGTTEEVVVDDLGHDPTIVPRFRTLLGQVPVGVENLQGALPEESEHEGVVHKLDGKIEGDVSHGTGGRRREHGNVWSSVSQRGTGLEANLGIC